MPKKKVGLPKIKKIFSLEWAFESFQEDPTFFTKRMFGGLAAYVHGRMVMLLAESPGDREWKDQVYPYDIWNGVLLPTEREYHQSLTKDFPVLVNHPVLPKWLYLPMLDSSFEGTACEISERISANDVRFGILPKEKVKRRKKLKL